MSSISTLKFIKLNDNRTKTATSVLNHLSQLDNLALTALEQQAYMRINPDANVDAEFIDAVGTDLTETITAFGKVKAKLEDILAVKAGTMTPEAMVAKYSIDLSDVSKRLL
jgi:uncharacterized membrane protein YqiK